MAAAMMPSSSDVAALGEGEAACDPVRDLLTAADIAAEIGVDAVTVRRRAEALGLGRRVGHAIVFDITDVVRLREPRTPGWPKGRRRTVEPG